MIYTRKCHKRRMIQQHKKKAMNSIFLVRLNCCSISVSWQFGPVSFQNNTAIILRIQTERQFLTLFAYCRFFLFFILLFLCCFFINFLYISRRYQPRLPRYIDTQCLLCFIPFANLLAIYCVLADWLTGWLCVCFFHLIVVVPRAHRRICQIKRVFSESVSECAFKFS